MPPYSSVIVRFAFEHILQFETILVVLIIDFTWKIVQKLTVPHCNLSFLDNSSFDLTDFFIISAFTLSNHVMTFKLESPPTRHPRQQRGDVGRRVGGGGIAQWCMLISPKYPCSSCTISVATPVATVLSTCFCVSLLQQWGAADPQQGCFRNHPL